ncbi:MAG: lytic transglycosylase domain-containing protein [Flavobacteriales bacterium]
MSGLIGAAAAVLVLVVSAFMNSAKPGPAENEEYLKHIQENYRIFSLPLPEKIDFCGEEVPLNDPDASEKLDRELLVNSYWHSNTLLSIKRARRWFPVIEPILKENGVPDDFKYLALIESGLLNVTSPSGAVGYWQFLPETAIQYGLIVNDEVDERYNVEKSTQAACRYLKEAFARFGSWSMVAASYNMGMGGLAKQVQKQGQNNYFQLLLNDETARYVFRILSMKEIVNNADKYGFVIRPSDLYEPYKFSVVEVDSTIDDFAAFAKQYNLTYKQVKMLNPWLRQGYLKNKERKVFQIKIAE